VRSKGEYEEVNEPDRQQPFRVGRRNSRNIYAVNLDSRHHTDDEHIGVMFRPEDGPVVVNALNAVEQGKRDTATMPARVHQFLVRAFLPDQNGKVSTAEAQPYRMFYTFAPDEKEAARAFHRRNPRAVIRDLWQLMPPGYLGANVFTPDRDECAAPKSNPDRGYDW
jgi:hypothetical protein